RRAPLQRGVVDRQTVVPRSHGSDGRERGVLPAATRLLFLVGGEVDGEPDRGRDEHDGDGAHEPRGAPGAREVLPGDADRGQDQRPRGEYTARDIEAFHARNATEGSAAACGAGPRGQGPARRAPAGRAGRGAE